MPRKQKCTLCGAIFDTGLQALSHKLVAHPAQEPSRRARIRRLKNALARVHRRLEDMGLSETQAHQVVELLTKELWRGRLL